MLLEHIRKERFIMWADFINNFNLNVTKEDIKKHQEKESREQEKKQ